MYGTCFNIAHLEPSSQIYGPGNRFVVWFQGCTLACKGCWNTAMWPHKPNVLVERERIFEQILAVRDITGVTLLGGEPLQQAENVLWLLRSLDQSGLDVMFYTGYETGELDDIPHAREILTYIDILIAGRYDHSLRNTSLRWRGSENQEVLFLTDKYDSGIIQECNQVEIHIDEFGGVVTLGYPD